MMLSCSPMQFYQVDRQVKDAIEKGGRIVMGGTRGQGTFYPPTLLLDAKPVGTID